MSYIPALWSGACDSELTGEPQWREKAEKDMERFIADRALAKAEPRRLTSPAGALAFADDWVPAHNAPAQARAWKCDADDAAVAGWAFYM
jgi:hypothetical protein